MAYNPTLYNQYGQPQPYSWYQPMQTMASAQTAAQPVNGLVSVTGMEGAKAYQLPPNSSMPLFDSNEDMLYLKTTDSGGFPTIRAFRFEAADSEEQPKDTAEYATKEDLDALAAKVEELVAPKPRARKASDGE